MGGHRDAGPGVEAGLRQGFSGRAAQVAHPLQRRRNLRPLGPDEGGGKAELGPQGRHGQGRRIGADDDQAGLRIEAAEKCKGLGLDAADPAAPGEPKSLLERRRQISHPLSGRNAGAVLAVADPERGEARVHQLDQSAGGGIVRADAFDQHLDAAAAGQAHVGGAAAAIDQPPRTALAQHRLGMDRRVRLHAAAGKEAGDGVLAEQHLGPDPARRAAVGREQGGQGAGFAGVQQAPQARPDIVLEAEQRPVDVLQVHARPLVSAAPSDRRSRRPAAGRPAG